jgi:hypothetical protein
MPLLVGGLSTRRCWDFFQQIFFGPLSAKNLSMKYEGAIFSREARPSLFDVISLCFGFLLCAFVLKISFRSFVSLLSDRTE